jgi:hypothetical protein
MKKKLNIDSITNELEGSSLFFTRSVTPPPVPLPEQVEPSLPDSSISTETEAPREKPENIKKSKETKTVNDDTVIPRHHDTTVSRYQDTTTPQIHGVPIEPIRKAVKEFGKEAATHRFTVAEKKEIADLIYTYKNRGIKTSENEIARVAVNFVVGDYKVNGENSVLHKILKALKE